MDRDAAAVVKEANEAVFVRVADFVQTHVTVATKVSRAASASRAMCTAACATAAGERDGREGRHAGMP